MFFVCSSILLKEIVKLKLSINEQIAEANDTNMCFSHSSEFFSIRKKEIIYFFSTISHPFD